MLSDSEKRSQYDRFGDQTFEGNGNGSGNTDFDFGDFFKEFDSAFNAHRGGHKHKSGGAPNFKKNTFQFDFGNLFDDDDDDGGFGNFESMFEGIFNDFGGGDDLFGDMFDNLHVGASKYRRAENAKPNLKSRNKFSASTSTKGVCNSTQMFLL